MIYVAALVALHVAVFAWRAVDDGVGAAALPVVQGALALVGVAIPSVRRAMSEAALRYWPSALATLALAALMLAGAHGFDVRAAPAMTWRLLGLLMAALASAGGAIAAGRRQSRNAILAGAIVLGALAVIEHLQSARALFTNAGEANSLFALLCVLAIYTAIEQLSARGAPAPMERRTTRAQRVLLPSAALLACLIGLAMTPSPAGLASFAIAVGAMAAALLARERRRGAGAVLLAALAFLGLGGGGALIVIASRGGERLGPVLTLNAAAALIALAWAALLISLATAPDRRRRPSRGLALALACLAILALGGAAAAAPAPFAVMALILGLAAAQVDELTRLSPGPRT